MENQIGVGILLGMVIGASIIAVSILFMGFFRNKDRYNIPKYLPRDDERAWAIVSACSRRIWSLRKCKYIKYDNWDLGLLFVDDSIVKEYDTSPTFGDVILVPKKWGGLHAFVITQELSNRFQFVTTYLGEFSGKQQVIYDGRDRTCSKTIQ